MSKEKYICVDIKTGKEVSVPEDCSDYFYLFEGNMSCDCNRGPVFFGLDEDFSCGGERFRVKGHEPYELQTKLAGTK